MEANLEENAKAWNKEKSKRERAKTDSKDKRDW